MRPSDDGLLDFVCPRCRGDLQAGVDAYRCSACACTYPVICGIPDFRLLPDPYIGIEEDRDKGRALACADAAASFEALVRYYYSITPEDPPDLAERWTARAASEVTIATAQLDDAGFLSEPGSRRPLLDVGCSTGALLIAAAGHFAPVVGIDVAFRWLVIGAVRLRDAGVAAHLVCANAEHLPFRSAAFAAITCMDSIEHLRDPPAALEEAWRVSRPGAALLCTANNRLAPVPEPNLHLWGVGFLPRRFQPAYVRWRRRDLLPYAIVLRSSRELRRMIGAAGFSEIRDTPPPIPAPRVNGSVAAGLAVYERFRRQSGLGWVLRLAGPRLRFLARRAR